LRETALAIGVPMTVALAAVLVGSPRAGEATYANARAAGRRCATCHGTTHPSVEDLNDVGRYYMVERRLPPPDLPGLEDAPPAGAAGGPPAAPVAAGAPAPDGASGAAVFERTCAVCHGEDGDGTPRAKSLLDPLEHGSQPAQIEQVIRKGLSGTPMFAFEGLLSDAEIAAVAAHVAALTDR